METKTSVYKELADGLILRQATQADRDELLKLQKDYLGADSEVEIAYLVDGHYPGLGIEDFLVVTNRQGQLVSALMLAQINFRIGQTWLKLAQPEFVVSHPEYRGRGLIRQQFAVLDKWMQERQLPIAIIGGINYFYRQFGYEYGFQSMQSFNLTQEQLAQLPVAPDINVRRAMVADAEAMYNLVSEQEKNFDWQIQTSPATLGWSEATRSWENSSPQDYLAERDGQILSFIRVWQGTGAMEGSYTTGIYGDNLAAAQSLGAYCRRMDGVQKLRLSSAPNTAFIKWLQTTFQPERATPYTWYVRINDVLAVFQALAGEFERRIAASQFAGFSEEVVLGFYRYQIRLLFEQGKIKEITQLPGNQSPAIGIPPDLLPKLIMGFRSVDELAYLYPDFVSAKQWDLVRALFPALYGQMRFFLF